MLKIHRVLGISRIGFCGFAAVLVSASWSVSASAGVTPLAIAIVPPVQFPPADFSIVGARVSGLFGHHRNVYGFDFGVLGNITDQDFVGMGFAGGANITHGETTIVGLQVAGIANVNTQKTSVVGAQITAGINSNTAESQVVGLQLGVIGNLAHVTRVIGFQVGLYNRARSIYGFQIGLINQVDDLHGIQIGLVNFNRSGPFSVAPVINIGF